jgi:DNA-binding MarR family transcriptional regulator
MKQMKPAVKTNLQQKTAERQSTTDHIVWAVLRNAGHMMERVRDHELSRYGLTTRQAGILRHIKALGFRATPTAIARSTYREPTTVSAILNRMETQGLVKKTHDLRKKNQVHITLTKKGEQAYRQASRRESVYRILSRLDTETRRQLLRGLRKFQRSIILELAENYRDSFLQKSLPQLDARTTRDSQFTVMEKE